MFDKESEKLIFYVLQRAFMSSIGLNYIISVECIMAIEILYVIELVFLDHILKIGPSSICCDAQIVKVVNSRV